MRIIGGHDYYDSAQAYGHDPNIVFVRGEDVLGESAFERSFADVYFLPSDKVNKEYHWKDKFTELRDRNGRWTLCKVRVIFCGVFYTGLKASYWPEWGTKEPKAPIVFWNREEFTKWVTDNFRDTSVIYNVKGWGSQSRDNEILSSHRLSGDEYSTCLKNRVSIAIYDYVNREWKINCTGLKEVQFFKVFDAVSAFQELDMWMSGALGMPGNPMVEVADDVRMAKHGMDKWSFRKKVR